MPIPLLLLPIAVRWGKQMLDRHNSRPRCACGSTEVFATSCCSHALCHGCKSRNTYRDSQGTVVTCPYCATDHRR